MYENGGKTVSLYISEQSWLDTSAGMNNKVPMEQHPSQTPQDKQFRGRAQTQSSIMNG